MAEKYNFDAEIDKVLKLVIGSIYTNKDIFLRELISNASDASDKLRYEAISDSSLTDEGHEFKILVKLDRDKNRFIFRDHGIGMNKQDLIDNLGKIASSGTQKFAEAMKGSSSASPELIGQFGVGFYSCFMISDSVEVVSRKAGESEVNRWISEGVDSFSIEKLEGEEAENFTTGTEITLNLKEGEDSESYLDKFRVENVIKTYSNHISIPIELEHEDDVVSTINSAEAIWLKSVNSVTKDEYNEFYKSLSWMADEPFLTIHNKVEGALEFSSLLFIPTKKPFDLYSPERKSNVKLYVRRVFITDNDTSLLPEYLRFVRGVVDSSDLPLNISRETFQSNITVKKIGVSITKKILTELKKKMENDSESYDEFWAIFGNVIKEGLCRPDEVKDKILEVCRFMSSNEEGYVTLDSYISRMAANQKSVYYLTADSYEEAIANPHLELFKKKGVEVLLLTDTTDDFWTNVITSYKDKELTSILSADEELDKSVDEMSDKEKGENENDEKKEALAEEAMGKVIKCFDTVLIDRIENAKVSMKLVDTPICLSQKTGGMGIRMEKYLIEQKQLDKVSKKILEINPSHEIIKSLHELLSSGGDDYSDEVVDKVNLLFNCACISQDEPIQGKSAFAKMVFDLMQGAKS